MEGKQVGRPTQKQAAEETGWKAWRQLVGAFGRYSRQADLLR